MATCPNCGHVHTTTRTSKAVSLPERAEIDRAFSDRELSKDAYFEACKRIGFRDDLRFLIRVAGADLQGMPRVEALALLAELETREAKAADGKRINAIRDAYRVSKGSLKITAQKYREAIAA